MVCLLLKFEETEIAGILHLHCLELQTSLAEYLYHSDYLGLGLLIAVPEAV